MSSKVVVIGGNGRVCPSRAHIHSIWLYIPSCSQVARHLIRLLVKSHDVTGVVREPAHEEVVKSLGAKSLVLTLDAPLSDYTAAVEGAVVVYHCSGYSPPARGPDEPPVPQEEQAAGSKAEHDGTIRAYDAIEAVAGPKPRLIMMSGVDIRDPSKVPEHYVRMLSTAQRPELTFRHSYRTKRT
jgi:nucleoside-diphosphate-sugar epimerase